MRKLIVMIAASLAALPNDGAAARASEHEDLSFFLDGNGQKRPIKALEDWQRRRAQVVLNVQQVMGALPQPASPQPLDVEILEETDLGHSLRRKVSYHTDSPDRRVRAWLFLPRAALDEKRPAVLCLHQTTPIGKDEPAGLGPKTNLQYALELAQRGYVALAPDYPSFGEYQYEFDDDRYASGSIKAVYDNMRAVDYLQSLSEVDDKRIGCIGHSLGGHNAIFTAFFDERIKAVVSSCGFTQFAKYMGGDLAGWTSKRYMPRIAQRYGNSPEQVPFDFTELIASLAPRAFLAVAPVKDDNFDVEGVRNIMTAAGPIYALYGQPENLQADHPDVGHDFPNESRRKAYEFLDKHLDFKGAR
jgi:predicted dienelactone hydrolase